MQAIGNIKFHYVLASIKVSVEDYLKMTVEIESNNIKTRDGLKNLLKTKYKIKNLVYLYISSSTC